MIYVHDVVLAIAKWTCSALAGRPYVSRRYSETRCNFQTGRTACQSCSGLPGDSLTDLWVKINYKTIPITFDVYPLRELNHITQANDNDTYSLTTLSDETLEQIRSEGATLLVGTVSCGNRNRVRLYVMKTPLWDTDVQCLEIMQSSGRLSHSVSDLLVHCIACNSGAFRGGSDFESEADRAKLKRLRRHLIKEEQRWRDVVEGTWLTA